MQRLGTVAGLLTLWMGLVVGGIAQLEGRDNDTHGRNATPDYARVFAQDTVKRLDIRVNAADWDRLIADMTGMAGPRGSAGVGAGGGRGGFNIVVGPEALAACNERVEGDPCAVGIRRQRRGRRQRQHHL